MKITLSILLGVSVLLNIFLVGCHFLSDQERKTVAYDGVVLSDEQMDTLRVREKTRPDLLEIIEQYHLFIRNVKGKQLIVVEK